MQRPCGGSSEPRGVVGACRQDETLGFMPCATQTLQFHNQPHVPGHLRSSQHWRQEGQAECWDPGPKGCTTRSLTPWGRPYCPAGPKGNGRGSPPRGSPAETGVSGRCGSWIMVMTWVRTHRTVRQRSAFHTREDSVNKCGGAGAGPQGPDGRCRSKGAGPAAPAGEGDSSTASLSHWPHRLAGLLSAFPRAPLP